MSDYMFPFQVDCENLSNISVSTIPVYCPKLSSFDLKGMCYVTDHGVMPLTRSNDLKTLCLAEAAITDSTLESIAKGCGGKVRDTCDGSSFATSLHCGYYNSSV